MTTGDGNAIFLDTNILVYANAEESLFHQTALQAIQTRYEAGTELWVSRQVLREYLATLTRPQQYPNLHSVTALIEDIRLFQTRFRVAEDGPKVTERLLSLMAEVATGGRQVHDANIVATMQAHGLAQLLTHNVSDFNRFSRFIRVLPLVETEA